MTRRFGVLVAVGIAALVVSAGASAGGTATPFTASYDLGQPAAHYACSGTHFETMVSVKDVETCVVSGYTQGRVPGTYSGNPYAVIPGVGSHVRWLSDFDGTSFATNFTITMSSNGGGTFMEQIVAYYAPPPFALVGSSFRSLPYPSLAVNAYSRGTTMGTFWISDTTGVKYVKVQCVRGGPIDGQIYVGGTITYDTHQQSLAGHTILLAVLDAGATGDFWSAITDTGPPEYGGGQNLSTCPDVNLGPPYFSTGNFSVYPM